MYPDRKPMGFPFDRTAPPNVDNLARFMTPNMGKVDVSIQFNDRVAGPSANRQ